MTSEFHLGDTVEWKSGTGNGADRITDRLTPRVARTIDRTGVERNASQDEPTHLVEQHGGQRVLSSSTEMS